MQYAHMCIHPPLRPGKVDLQFIFRAFSKNMQTRGYSLFFVIGFGPVHVATESMIWCPSQTQIIHLKHLPSVFNYRINCCFVLSHIYTLNITLTTNNYYEYYRYHGPRRIGVVYIVRAMQSQRSSWSSFGLTTFY